METRTIARAVVLGALGIACLALLFAGVGFLGLRLIERAACGFHVVKEGTELPELYGRTIDDARGAVRSDASCLRLHVIGDHPCTDLPPDRIVHPGPHEARFTNRATVDVVLSREPTAEERAELQMTNAETRALLSPGPLAHHQVLSAKALCFGAIEIELLASDGALTTVRFHTLAPDL